MIDLMKILRRSAIAAIVLIILTFAAFHALAEDPTAQLDLGKFTPAAIRELCIKQAAAFTEQRQALDLAEYKLAHANWLRNEPILKAHNLAVPTEPQPPLKYLAVWSDELGEVVAAYTDERFPHELHARPPPVVSVSLPGLPWGDDGTRRMLRGGDPSKAGFSVSFDGATWERADYQTPFGPQKFWRRR